jgi:hypothetical protein
MGMIPTLAASFGRVCAAAPSAYGKPSPPFMPALANRISHRSLKRFRIVRTPRLPPALEEYVCQCLCLFCLSTMPLPLPLCAYQDRRPCYQPRFVHIRTNHFVIPQSHTGSSLSCDCNCIYGPVHSTSLCIVLLDNHLAFLIGRPFLQLLWFFRHLCCFGRGLLDLDEPILRWA